MKTPNLTYGETRRIIQKEHMKRLIIWILEQNNDYG